MLNFVCFNVLNVIMQTLKTLVTVRSNKYVAAVVNAATYGLYTYIVYITATDDIDLWFKILSVALANLVGVFIVKWIEERKRKDKLRKVEATVPYEKYESVNRGLAHASLPHNYILLEKKYAIFNIYCSTKDQAHTAREILDAHAAKYFISECGVI